MAAQTSAAGGQLARRRTPSRRLQLLAGLASRAPETAKESPGPLELLVSAASFDDPGATIAPASVSLAVQSEPAAFRPEPAAGGTMPQLRIEAGPDGGISRPIADDNLSVGRSLDNDLVLCDPATSGHHARFERFGVQVFIVDLESTNGTYVNGERVMRQELSHGDRISIGQDSFVLALPDLPASA